MTGPQLPVAARVVLPDRIGGDVAHTGAHVAPASRAVEVQAPGSLTLRHSVLERQVFASYGRVTIEDSLIAVAPSGPALTVRRCVVGSVDLPDGRHLRPVLDGLDPCQPGGRTFPVPGRPEAIIEDSLIVNTDGQYGDAHMDGVQMWWGGPLVAVRNRIAGWSTSCFMLKTDVGPIDRVLIADNRLDNRDGWYLIYVRDGGHGRPTNVTIRGNVLDRWRAKAPISTGNDQGHLQYETKYVRTEAERTDPTWIVWADNVRPDGTEVAPPGGWRRP